MGALSENVAGLRAAVIETDQLDADRVARAVLNGLKTVARDTGVLFINWPDNYVSYFADPRRPQRFAASTAGMADMIRKSLLRAGSSWLNYRYDPHGAYGSQTGNDGEPYEFDWPADAHAWHKKYEAAVKGMKITVSDKVISSKTGKWGFKVTISPALGKLPMPKLSNKADWVNLTDADPFDF